MVLLNPRNQNLKIVQVKVKTPVGMKRLTYQEERLAGVVWEPQYHSCKVLIELSDPTYTFEVS